MVKEIENDIYRIRTTNRTFLIEVCPGKSSDTMTELCNYCAERSVRYGEVITSVSQILENSNATPKIAVLSNQKYKKRVRELIAEQKAQGL